MARSNDKAGGVLDSDSAAAVAADDASDDSVTLVDDADDSITALDFDIPISSSRRSSSGASSINNKRKRRASVTSPAIKRARRSQQQTGNTNTSSSSIVHILPLRTQILDDHIKRRIRRNGLSAEMNSCYGEKRARRQKTLAELRAARDELRDRDAEIERLRELTALFDQSGDHSHQHHHVQEMEMELSRLREQVLGRRRRDGDDELMTSSPPVARENDGWGVMGGGGMSDGGSDASGDFGHDFDDDEEFGERSLAELESGGTTPAQYRQQQKPKGKKPTALHLHGPTLTPPSTSPAKLPSSPVRQIHSSAGGSSSTACNAGVQAAVAISGADASSQACIPDPQMDALHDELSTLRAEVSSLNDTLLERDALQTRVSEKLSMSSSVPPSAQPAEDQDQDVELQLDIILQDLAEKTARLGELSSLLMPSSSPTDKEATAQLASALQSVRGALADLDPNTTLPQTAAPLLTLTATRLRELDTTLKQRTADHDAKLAAATKHLAAAQASAEEKETAAKNLSLDITHLSETISALREELDTLQEHTASQALDLNTARDAALQQKTAAAEAETQLAEAFARIASLSKQLSSREAALQGSEGEVEALKVKLAEAGVTIARLREGNAREMGRSREVVRAMRAQMMLALSVGEGFLGDESGGVAKEEDGEGGGVVGGLDKAGRGRSDDSGLGLDGELQLV